MSERYTLEALKLENERLRHQVKRLERNQKRVTAHRERVERAFTDAMLLCALRFAGTNAGRTACSALGMSRRRHQWAMALIKVAGCINADPGDPATVERLEVARDKCLDNRYLLSSRASRHGRNVWNKVHR